MPILAYMVIYMRHMGKTEIYSKDFDNLFRAKKWVKRKFSGLFNVPF